ncbi:MAG: Ni/Fe-hydrogenase, b-type cytochrome subunit [Bacillota bacterium]
MRRVLVWELPVRLFHWATALSIIVLGITGYYIGSPFGSVSGDPAQAYLMGWVRFIHFVAAFVLGVALLVRLYWFFAGNRYASWREWIPVSRERRAFFWRQLKYYLFLSRERPLHLGHNPVAGLSYLVIALLILVQGLTGFALYAEAFQDGFWRVLFGWPLVLFKNQDLRLVHHLAMWIFGAFLVVHLYMGILADIEERNGTLRSIFGGCKFEEEKEAEQPAAALDLGFREAAAAKQGSGPARK